MVRILYFLLILLSTQGVMAQTSLRDSIIVALRARPRMILGIHNRTTFVNANNVTLYGLKLGLDYDHKVLLYTGFYGLSNQNRKWLIDDDRFNRDSIQRRTHYYNLSIGLAYTIEQRGALLIRVPFQIGVGNVVHDHYDGQEYLFRQNDLVIPVEIGLDFSYQLFEYLMLKASTGYRFSLGNKEVLQLSSPYYNLGVAVPLGKIYRDLIAPEL